MMNGIQNLMRREAMRVGGQDANVRIGIVSGYDPANYSAKVRIQPEDVETGWLPIGSAWSGDGWGEFCGLNLGDVVYVHFQEGGKDAGFIGGRHFGDQFRPLPVPAGEKWTVHKSGSLLKFRNDGSIEIAAASAITSRAPVWNHAGDFNVDGIITATEDIYDLGSGSGSMQNIRAVYDSHTHPYDDGDTGTPNQHL